MKWKKKKFDKISTRHTTHDTRTPEKKSHETKNKQKTIKTIQESTDCEANTLGNGAIWNKEKKTEIKSRMVRNEKEEIKIHEIQICFTLLLFSASVYIYKKWKAKEKINSEHFNTM